MISDEQYKELVSKIDKILERDRQNKESDYMTIEEAAKFTTFAESTIYSWVSKRKIPFIKKYGKIIFKRDQLQQWLNESTVSEAYTSNARQFGSKIGSINILSR